MARKPDTKPSLYDRAVAVEVKLSIYSDPATHQQIVVPSVEDLDQSDQWVANLDDQAEDLLAQGTDESLASGSAMRVAASIQRNEARRRREAADALRPLSVQHNISLVRPSLLQFHSARNLALQSFPEGSGPGFDSVLVQELLPVALALDSAADIEAGEVASILWDRLQTAMFPSPDALVFFARRSSVTSKGS